MKLKSTAVAMPDDELSKLADAIVSEIEAGRQRLAVSINRIVKDTYWNVGRHIVEFEQQGSARAKYGAGMLSKLARILRSRAGRGYSHPNLNNMRKFYLLYPNFQTSEKSPSQVRLSDDRLTWSHICASKYELYLPNKDELRAVVREITHAGNPANPDKTV